MNDSHATGGRQAHGHAERVEQRGVDVHDPGRGGPRRRTPCIATVDEAAPGDRRQLPRRRVSPSRVPRRRHARRRDVDRRHEARRKDRRPLSLRRADVEARRCTGRTRRAPLSACPSAIERSLRPDTLHVPRLRHAREQRATDLVEGRASSTRSGELKLHARHAGRRRRAVRVHARRRSHRRLAAEDRRPRFVPRRSGAVVHRPEEPAVLRRCDRRASTPRSSPRASTARSSPDVNVDARPDAIQWNSVRRAEGNGFYTWDTERKEVPAGTGA